MRLEAVEVDLAVAVVKTHSQQALMDTQLSLMAMVQEQTALVMLAR
jgi:hypothetical protein